VILPEFGRDNGLAAGHSQPLILIEWDVELALSIVVATEYRALIRWAFSQINLFRNIPFASRGAQISRDSSYIQLARNYTLLGSAHPEMANLPDIFVSRKILSLEYQPYALQGHFLRGACVKIFRAPWSRPNSPVSERALGRDLKIIKKVYL